MKNSLVLLFLIAISSCSQNVETPKDTNKSIKEQPIITSVNKPKNVQEQVEATEFSYKNLEDKEVKLSDYRGKWVVVNFWATWCPPCRKEIPDFIKFKNLYSEQVEILGINNEDAEVDKIKDFVFEYQINYPILRANVYQPSEFSQANTMGLPTTVIFNPLGVQVAKRVGPMHFKDLLALVDVK